MDKVKYFIFSVVIIFLIVITFNILRPQNQPAVVSTNNIAGVTDNAVQTSNFQLMIEVQGKETKNYSVVFTSGQTLDQILNNLASKDSTFSYTTQTASFGAFITTFNGTTADATKEFWSFKVNGEDSSVGISDFKPQNNDLIQFTLTSF